jgi:serine/threonine protein kinase
MEKIKLVRDEWFYDPKSPLGPEGGFGVVFSGYDSNKKQVAVKKIKISARDAAHREMRIADDLTDKNLNHVIPVFDSGEDADSDDYFVVMAKAEKSLQDELNSGVRFSERETASILLEIAYGLSEVENMIHRDLKPANVLMHESNWKIADFGIAKFVEESTSARTLKDCLSPQYAAPEQWNLEHVTNETDVYALGCIGYALLTGTPPFPGKTLEDYKQKHLNEPPPTLNCSASIRSLLQMMLRKNSKARPNLDRVIKRLKTILENHDKHSQQKSANPLEEADAHVSDVVSSQEAAAAKHEAKMQERKRLSDEAYLILRELIEFLFNRILEAAPNANKQNLTSIRLGDAIIELNILDSLQLYKRSLTLSQWDIIAGATILVRQSKPSYEWSSSLWYTNLGKNDNYRWYEVSYMISPLIAGEKPRYQPFSLVDLNEVDAAASPALALHQIAFGPKLIDDEQSDEFCNRWEGLLARAVKGEIRYPSHLPIN